MSRKISFKGAAYRPRISPTSERWTPSTLTTKDQSNGDEHKLAGRPSHRGKVRQRHTDKSLFCVRHDCEYVFEYFVSFWWFVLDSAEDSSEEGVDG